MNKSEWLIAKTLEIPSEASYTFYNLEFWFDCLYTIMKDELHLWYLKHLSTHDFKLRLTKGSVLLRWLISSL